MFVFSAFSNLIAFNNIKCAIEIVHPLVFVYLPFSIRVHLSKKFFRNTEME